MQRLVGLHIRYHQSPFELFEHAERLNIRTAQLFMHDETGRAAHLNDDSRKQFKKQRAATFDLLFAHGSYAINCADPRRIRHPILEHDIQLANSLGCTHLIVHAGSAPTLESGIDALARLINTFNKQQFDLKFVLENTAFKHPSIGSDIAHFSSLLEKIDKPEKILFCIDTAHAYAAGYDIASKMDDFILLLSKKIGIDHIALIHLNDTSVACASHIDLHAQLGHGLIGINALHRFATHNHLAPIPLILELPIVSASDEQQAIDLVKSWNKESL